MMKNLKVWQEKVDFYYRVKENQYKEIEKIWDI